MVSIKAYIQFYLIAILFIASTSLSLAQNTECSKCLNYAQDVLSSPDGEDGRVELLPDTLTICIEKGTSKEKQEALLLLTEAYIFMKQEANADTTYLDVLHRNPIYNPEGKGEKRPIELIQHAKKFRSSPLFSVEVRAGVNAPYLRTLENFNTDNLTSINPPNDTDDDYDGLGKYGIAIGLETGFLATYHPTKLLSISTGLSYTNRKYNYNKTLSYYDPTLDSQNRNEALGLSFQESQTWLDIPLIFRFNFGNKKYIPYVYAGAEFNYLLSAKFSTISRKNTQSNAEVKNFDIIGDDGKSLMRNTINYSAIGGLGLRMKQGAHFLIFDLKYGFMFNDIVVLENLYTNSRLVYEFGHVDNHFQFHNISFTLGYQRAFYKAKKLKN